MKLEILDVLSQDVESFCYCSDRKAEEERKEGTLASGDVDGL